MANFQAGDLVKLKSGKGPVMTVTGHHTTNVTVTWYDEDDNAQFAEYPEDDLVKA